jgi:transposase
LNANLLFAWRRQRAAGAPAQNGKSSEFAPVTVVAESDAQGIRSCDGDGASVGRMEVVLAGGERIIVDADVDAAALARVIKALTQR